MQQELNNTTKTNSTTFLSCATVFARCPLFIEKSRDVKPFLGSRLVMQASKLESFGNFEDTMFE